jgi:hypothetical protein
VVVNYEDVQQVLQRVEAVEEGEGKHLLVAPLRLLLLLLLLHCCRSWKKQLLR